MRVLCFGDSNTYGYDPRSYFGGRYPADARWVDLLAQKTGWEVRNAGENGREIPRREGDLRRFAQLLDGCRPLDLLLVLLGGNDLLQGADAAGAAARMEGFLSQIPLDREKILLIGPPLVRMGAWVTEERLVAESAQLSAAYETVAKKLGTHFVDGGGWEIGLTFDGVHFTEQGHRTFAEELYRALQ